MLRQTFSHISGIGRTTELRLWEAGITDWSLWRNTIPVRLSAISKADAPKVIEKSEQALKSDPAFFTSALSSSDSWRIFPHFRHRTAYLDIETTGAESWAEITTISLYDGQDVFTYVNGDNLNDFVDDIQKYQVLVTYNGKSFDIPVIERFFRIRLNVAQIDLRYVLAKLGIKGGLKGCEKQLGLNRGNLDGVDGWFAVLLWRQYQASGDPKALETLLAYNIEDTVNLERLMVEAYNRNILQTPLGDDLLQDCPPPPPNPFVADYDCIESIRRNMPQY